MTSDNRQRLPETRESVTRKESIGTIDMYVRVSFYPASNNPGEVFVDILKEGTVIAGLLDVWAITISVALQYGATWKTLRRKFMGTKFDPQGINPRTGVEFSSLAEALSHAVDVAVIARCDELGVERPAYLAETVMKGTPVEAKLAS